MLFAGAGGADLLAREQKVSSKAGAKHWKVGAWTGDDFTVGHKLRAGQLPKFSEKPEKTHEVVIIGGGIAGIASAFYLRNDDFVLLEQYAEAGGHERGGTFHGIDYSYGAAFVGSVEGQFGEFYGDLGIKPYKVDKGENAWFWEKKWHRDAMQGSNGGLYSEFRRLIKSLPAIPDDDTASVIAGSPELSKLDTTPFSSMLSGYSAEFISLLDSVCRSGACGGTQRVSALVGAGLVRESVGSCYVFEGGNSAIASAALRSLRETGANRIETGCFVWSAELSESGAKVQYTDSAGNPHTIACKHLIVATPPMVAWRQLKNIDDKTRAAMMQYKYGSYLVANCLLDKPVFQEAYDNWLPSPYTISDVVVADTPYKLAGKYKPGMGSVLTAYHPWEPGSEGRTLLLEGDRTKLSSQVHEQMQTFISTLDEHLVEMVLTRWGHALAVPTPGYYARIAKLLSSYQGSYSLAHSTFHGMPCTESAIRGARYAADRVLRMSK